MPGREQPPAPCTGRTGDGGTGPRRRRCTTAAAGVRPAGPAPTPGRVTGSHEASEVPAPPVGDAPTGAGPDPVGAVAEVDVAEAERVVAAGLAAGRSHLEQRLTTLVAEYARRTGLPGTEGPLDAVGDGLAEATDFLVETWAPATRDIVTFVRSVGRTALERDRDAFPASWSGRSGIDADRDPAAPIAVDVDRLHDVGHAPSPSARRYPNGHRAPMLRPASGADGGDGASPGWQLLRWGVGSTDRMTDDLVSALDRMLDDLEALLLGAPPEGEVRVQGPVITT